MYKFPVEKCDVVDRPKLNKFREIRARWLEQLNGDDLHSIWKQLPTLFWNDTVFRVVNEARKIAQSNPHPDVGFNGPISRLLDVGFVTVQIAAIRRLTEKQSPISNRAVISLRTVLDEIKGNIALITRENYVCFDGLPYDPEPLRIAWLEKKAAEPEPIVEGLETSGPNAWSQSDIVHKHFDKLAGVLPTARTRDDLIDVTIVDRLIARLQGCEDVCKYVDKFIAHGADPSNREALTDEEKTITLEKLDNCYKALYQVAYYTTGTLLWIGSFGGLPVPQYDHLKDLDKKWITTANLEKAHEMWDAREKEIEAWSSDSSLEKLHLSKDETV